MDKNNKLLKQGQALKFNDNVSMCWFNEYIKMWDGYGYHDCLFQVLGTHTNFPVLGGIKYKTPISKYLECNFISGLVVVAIQDGDDSVITQRHFSDKRLALDYYNRIKSNQNKLNPPL